jgi:hypothetical protein
MRTPYKKIIDNKATIAEFTASSINNEFITQIVESLEHNTSVQTISFDGSHLHDKQLKILAEALMRVGRKREALILDNTEITKDSVPVLEDLIKSKVIGSLFLYATEDISESPEIKANLQKLSADNQVSISFASRTQRQALGLFNKSAEEKSNDLSSEEENLSSDEEKDGKMHLGKI